jgi:hypothetical protein
MYALKCFLKPKYESMKKNVRTRTLCCTGCDMLVVVRGAEGGGGRSQLSNRGLRTYSKILNELQFDDLWHFYDTLFSILWYVRYSIYQYQYIRHNIYQYQYIRHNIYQYQYIRYNTGIYQYRYIRYIIYQYLRSQPTHILRTISVDGK